MPESSIAFSYISANSSRTLFSVYSSCPYPFSLSILRTVSISYDIKSNVSSLLLSYGFIKPLSINSPCIYLYKPGFTKTLPAIIICSNTLSASSWDILLILIALPYIPSDIPLSEIKPSLFAIDRNAELRTSSKTNPLYTIATLL